MGVNDMNKKILQTLTSILLLTSLLTGCNVQQQEWYDTIGISQGVVSDRMIIGDGSIAATVEYYFDYYGENEGCAIATIKPTDYQFYYRLMHLGSGKTLLTGYVVYTCRILDVSKAYNNTSLKTGDTITLKEWIYLMPKILSSTESDEKYEAFAEKRTAFMKGLGHDDFSMEFSEEELESGIAYRDYLIPRDKINSDDFEMLLLGDVGFMAPDVEHDVFLIPRLTDEKTDYPYHIRYACAKDASSQYDDVKVNVASTGTTGYEREERLFYEYLTENKQKLGLDTVAVKK